MSGDSGWLKRVVAVGVPVAIVAVGSAGLLGPDRNANEALATYWEAPRFVLVDQAGDTLRSDELLSRPWVASFVFTSCAGVCPLITTRMAQLRDSLRARRPTSIMSTIRPGSSSWTPGASCEASIRERIRTPRRGS